MTKHVVCFSGGEGSALVGVEVVRRHGTADTIFLNHDICARVEDADIKRFKEEVAVYCGVPLTYANMAGWEEKDQFDVVVEAQAFKVGTGTALCTNRMKTDPFMRWLAAAFPTKDCVIYYGFGAAETDRIQRRVGIMGALGYRTEYPLAHWPRTIQRIEEIGVKPPLTYSLFKHANCVGCLKAGRQHWYVVYCVRPDLWEKGKWAEEEIGYTIIKGVSLLDLEPMFAKMRDLGVEPTEKVPPQRFWRNVKKLLKEAGDVEEAEACADEGSRISLPCECLV